jgi:prefoldin subunit 1
MSELDSMVGEMRMQLRQQQIELQKTLASIDAISRSNAAVEKSSKEIKDTGNEFVWEAVGRAFVKIPVVEYEAQMKSKIRDHIESMNVLNKKKHYLETSIKNTVDSLKKVLDRT